MLKTRISSIRRKIREAGGNEEMIRTVHSVGYSLTPV
jgi:DNA-binding response OmpR family regulator